MKLRSLSFGLIFIGAVSLVTTECQAEALNCILKTADSSLKLVPLVQDIAAQTYKVNYGIQESADGKLVLIPYGDRDVLTAIQGVESNPNNYSSVPLIGRFLTSYYLRSDLKKTALRILDAEVRYLDSSKIILAMGNILSSGDEAPARIEVQPSDLDKAKLLQDVPYLDREGVERTAQVSLNCQ